ncbi:IclR family pca regulon transcriptional regulator [Novosphingobium chloroacetimidivorans]|uniref:IclR family pca regulon transcriptional regulator n=1 Tax=Novosphingobium chloroacetimidivorans TaxID=1428314 RepID=A0A7W7K8I9_9SPHN|nr:IclR family transcriptional regulator C-terminal domain-containing protein [Novosphingobium chloroacetimidivorans]MBB4857955.1 IclR family pca regulon transcriptional regulator [Novosphingobium chloroacetimidivorans]
MPRVKKTTEDQGERSKDFLDALDRSIRVIEKMGSGSPALTLSDIAKMADLPRPTTKRILYTLSELGYVGNVGRNFALTPKVVRLATSFFGAGGKSRLVQVACDEISETTGQACLATVLDDTEVLVVAYAISQQLMAPYLGVGARFPAFCTAPGRLLLAQMDDNALDAFLAKLEPVAQTDATVLDKAAIRQGIVTARAQGFCVMEDEYIAGWWAVAYPLRRSDGSLFGALSLNCKKSPATTTAELGTYAKLCAERAKALEPQLGD